MILFSEEVEPQSHLLSSEQDFSMSNKFSLKMYCEEKVEKVAVIGGGLVSY